MMNLAGHIEEQARAVDRKPTDGQKEAGNYKKGHVKIHGLDISIENPRGSYRSGTDPKTGKPWRAQLPHHYGYIRKTEGSDGDHVDVYLGPHLKSPRVFVIDQYHLTGGKTFDEHKTFIGFGSETQAREAYHRAFSDGRGKDRIGHIETMTVDEFKDWLEGDTTSPVKHRAEGGKVQAEKVLPPDHRLGMKVPKGGSMCANCRFLSSPTTCGNKGFIQWNGGAKLPDPADEYCCDLFEPAKKRADGGRIEMADGGVPAFDPNLPIDAPAGPPPFDPSLPIDNAPDQGALSALGHGAASGATFGFSDELRGVHAAGPEWMPEMVGPVPARMMAGAARLAKNYLMGSDPEALTTYEKSRDEERQAQASAKANHPYYYGAGEIAGSLPAMAALPEAGIARGAGLGANMVRGALVGGEYGALSGTGEGTDLTSRATNAGSGLIGGVIGGAAAPVLGKVAEGAYNRFVQPGVSAVRGWLNPEGEAGRRLAGALQKDQEMIAAGTAKGMSVQEWVAARQAGEPVTLADLGAGNTQALLRSAANTSPEGRAMLEKVIEDRFLGQSERVASDVRGLVAGGANASKTAEDLVADYDRARKPAYLRAYREGDREIMTPEMERIMASPMVVEAMRRAAVSGKDRAVTEGLGAFNPGVTVENGMVNFKPKPNGVPTYPNLQFWDATKRELDDIASSAGRGGEKGKAQVAGDLSRTLRTELDNEVPSYANARGIASQYFGESNALEAGRNLAGKRVDPQAISDVMQKMKPDERDLFREGYASDWANRVINNISDTRDITKAMFNSPNERVRALAVFGPAGMAKIQARMTLETIMDGARKAMGNSTTARQLIEAGLAGGALEGYLSGWDPTRMAEGAAGAAGARKFLGTEMAAGARKIVGKVDSTTARNVARLLTSNNPDDLAQGLRMATQNRKIADGLKNIANRVALSSLTPAAREQAIRITPLLQGAVSARADQEQQQSPRVGNQ